MPTSKDITLNIAHNKLLRVEALVAEILQTSVRAEAIANIEKIVHVIGLMDFQLATATAKRPVANGLHG